MFTRIATDRQQMHCSASLLLLFISIRRRVINSIPFSSILNVFSNLQAIPEATDAAPQCRCGRFQGRPRAVRRGSSRGCSRTGGAGAEALAPFQRADLLRELLAFSILSFLALLKSSWANGLEMRIESRKIQKFGLQQKTRDVKKINSCVIPNSLEDLGRILAIWPGTSWNLISHLHQLSGTS